MLKNFFLFYPNKYSTTVDLCYLALKCQSPQTLDKPLGGGCCSDPREEPEKIEGLEEVEEEVAVAKGGRTCELVSINTSLPSDAESGVSTLPSGTAPRVLLAELPNVVEAELVFSNVDSRFPGED